jgi:Lon protease (S16) C-terminal proteolytic domain
MALNCSIIEVTMTIREHERRQRQRQASHRENEECRQQQPRKPRRYLRKMDLCRRYGWKAALSVDRAWRIYGTLPPPTTWQSRSPLWDEAILDAHDAANGLRVQKVKMGMGQQVDTTDFHVEAIDLLGNHVPSEAGIALVVAVYSAIKRQSVQAGLIILGDLSIQGNIKSVRSLAEPLQVAMENGARRALVPLENKRNFLEVSGDVVERVDPIFFSDPMTAAMKALGMT